MRPDGKLWRGCGWAIIFSILLWFLIYGLAVLVHHLSWIFI